MTFVLYLAKQRVGCIVYVIKLWASFIKWESSFTTFVLSGNMIGLRAFCFNGGKNTWCKSHCSHTNIQQIVGVKSVVWRRSSEVDAMYTSVMWEWEWGAFCSLSSIRFHEREDWGKVNWSDELIYKLLISIISFINKYVHRYNHCFHLIKLM